jgi:hypothetical protein
VSEYSDSYDDGDGKFEFTYTINGKVYRRAVLFSSVVGISEDISGDYRYIQTPHECLSADQSYDELVAMRWPERD